MWNAHAHRKLGDALRRQDALKVARTARFSALRILHAIEQRSTQSPIQARQLRLCRLWRPYPGARRIHADRSHQAFHDFCAQLNALVALCHRLLFAGEQPLDDALWVHHWALLHVRVAQRVEPIADVHVIDAFSHACDFVHAGLQLLQRLHHRRDFPDAISPTQAARALAPGTVRNHIYHIYICMM